MRLGGNKMMKYNIPREKNIEVILTCSRKILLLNVSRGKLYEKKCVEEEK